MPSPCTIRPRAARAVRTAPRAAREVLPPIDVEKQLGSARSDTLPETNMEVDHSLLVVKDNSDFAVRDFAVRL